MQKGSSWFVTSVVLQRSTSDQQPSSMTLHSPHSGFIITAERDDTTTTLLTTSASEHALRTFMVPVTAGARISTCNNNNIWRRTYGDCLSPMEITRIEKACIALSRQRGERARECWCLGVSEGIVGDGAGHVEDAAAACDGRRHAAVVEHRSAFNSRSRSAAPSSPSRCAFLASPAHESIVIHTLTQSLKLLRTVPWILYLSTSYRDRGRCGGPCIGRRRGGARRAMRPRTRPRRSRTPSSSSFPRLLPPLLR